MKLLLQIYKPPILAAFGNPLLDMCTKITNFDILDKYGLKPNGQKEIGDEELDIFKDVRSSFTMEYHPGGAAQNTLRIFQWLISHPFYSVFFGGIGNDEEGKLLEEMVKSSGVETRYAYHDNYPTGTCLALISGEDRSLVGHLGAANIYQPSDLNVSENIHILNQVNMIYIESFFVSHSYDVALQLVNLCKDRKIALVFNIGAVYMCSDFIIEVSHLAKCANILFGNREEFLALGRVLNLKSESVKDIALAVQKMNSGRGTFTETHALGQYLEELGKIVVVTDGKDPVLCVYGNSINTPSIVEYSVPVLEQEMIKDTTGAGDSFVAGFLVGLFVRHNVKTCISWGCWTARQVIQLIGCQVPPYPPDEINKIKC